MPAASDGTTARGYGYEHQQERERWRPFVERGEVDCWRCGERIEPDALWDLGHDDRNRGHYRGPEHRGCNRSAGARIGNRMRIIARRRRRLPKTRETWPILTARFLEPDTRR